MPSAIPPQAAVPRQAEDFGNHHRKFLKAWDDGGAPLLEALERAGLSDQVPLDRPFDDPVLELHHVCAAMGGHEAGPETLRGMATYYANHFLRLNAQAVEHLLRARASGDPLLDERFPKLVELLERRFRALSRGFLHHTLAHHAQGAPLPSFAMLFVGAMSDHEDLDIAVIAEGVEGETFRTALGRTQTTFFRHAQKLDPHLSQYIPGHRIWADVDEYKEILSRDLKNFVVVSQVIGAGYLVGDRKLFARFRSEVHRRYFSRGDDAPFHEGFVRGAIGELRYLLAAEHSPAVIDPKAEVYRPIKMLVAALRTVFGVEGSNVTRGLRDLAAADPPHAPQYAALARTYAFNETLRYLYALHVVQEDQIHLENAELEAPLGHIADLMGFADTERLIAAYDDNLTETLRSARVLTGVLSAHLREMSYFHRAFREGRLGERRGSATSLLDLIQGFEGKIFWDNIVDLLRQHPSVLADISEDLAGLDPPARRDIIRPYVQLMAGDVTSLMNLLVVIASRARDERDHALAGEFLDAVVEAASADPQVRSDYLEFCYASPDILYRVIGLYPPERSRALMDLTTTDSSDPRGQGALHRHKALRILAYGHSKYLGRFVHKVLRGRPHFVEVVEDFRRARGLAGRVLSEAHHATPHDQRIRTLGEYFDLEFVRTAIHALLGQSQQLLDEEFRSFTDLFVRTQIEMCTAHVLDLDRLDAAEGALADFALFATGGNARGEAFHDDYDYIAVVDTDDDRRVEELNRVVAGAHRGILKRALVPHNRLIERFGRYVVTLSELDEFFRERRADLFIDQSEMLDSRLVAGDPKMSWRFAKRIMAPHVYGRRDTYCAAMVEELTARHADEATSSDVIAIKEGRGGLRDINMLLLTLKAAHGVKAPLAAEVWAALAESADDEKIRAALGQLEGHYRFLRRVRDLYRLSVAYEETVSPAHLSDLLDIAPLEVMGDDPDALATRTREHMAGAHDCIQRVLRATQLV